MPRSLCVTMLLPFTLSFIALAGCRTPDVEAGGSAVKDQWVDAEMTPSGYEPLHFKIAVDPHLSSDRSAAAARVFSQQPSKTPDGAPEGASLTEGSSRFFFTMFGFQGTGLLNLPRNTHSWAVFSRVDGPNLASDQLSAFTLSWDAADGQIGIGSGGIEPGHNYTHADTLALAASKPVQMRRSWTVEISAELYNRAVDRYFYFTQNEGPGGAVLYRGLDNMQARKLVLAKVPGGYTNCMHAVSDLLTYADGSLLATLLKGGFAGSDAVFNWFLSSPYIVSTDGAIDAVLAQRLGL